MVNLSIFYPWILLLGVCHATATAAVTTPAELQLQRIMDQLNQFNPLWARSHIQATLDKLDVIEDMPSAEAQALVRETRDLFAQLNFLCRRTGVALNDLLTFIDRFKADLRNQRLAV